MRMKNDMKFKKAGYDIEESWWNVIRKMEESRWEEIEKKNIGFCWSQIQHAASKIWNWNLVSVALSFQLSCLDLLFNNFPKLCLAIQNCKSTFVSMINDN